MFFGFVHEFFKAFGKLFFDVIDLSLVVSVKFFLFQVECVALEDELLESVEDVFLDETKVTGQLLMMDVFLDFVVEANSLDGLKGTKFL